MILRKRRRKLPRKKKRAQRKTFPLCEERDALGKRR
jgi:hypothetical protein